MSKMGNSSGPPNKRRAKALRRRMMRIGACFDLAGIDACEDSLPEELDELLSHSLDQLKSALGGPFCGLMDEIDCEDDDDPHGVALQFSYAIGTLGLNGFLIRAEQQSPPADVGWWGSYSMRLFYGDTYEQAVTKALQWGDKNIERFKAGAP